MTREEAERLDAWKKICEAMQSIELTQEEKDQLNAMLEAEKRAKDPAYWKDIILGAALCPSPVVPDEPGRYVMHVPVEIIRIDPYPEFYTTSEMGFRMLNYVDEFDGATFTKEGE